MKRDVLSSCRGEVMMGDSTIVISGSRTPAMSEAAERMHGTDAPVNSLAVPRYTISALRSDSSFR